MKLSNILIVLLLLAAFIPAAPASAQDQTSYPVYIVQSGDNLSSIASRFGISLEELENANNITDPNAIYIGMQLIIPGLQGIEGVLSTVTIPLGSTYLSTNREFQVDSHIVSRLNHITSPAEFFAGASMILPVQNSEKPLQPAAQISQAGSLLDAALTSGENPWTLALLNQQVNQWDYLPGELLFASEKEGRKVVNAVSENLLSLTIDPLPITQGDTVVIRIESAKPVTLSGEMDGRQLAFHQNENGAYIALQGIHAMASIGLSAVHLKGEFEDGTRFDFQQSLLLKDAHFFIDPPLYVPPEMINPEVTEKELLEIEKLVAPQTEPRTWNGIFASPSVYQELTSSYGNRRSFNDSPYDYFHTGVDFAGGFGLPISAPAPGVVVFAGLLDVRGNATIIDHGWGVYTGYWHQSEIKVKTGDRIEKGQVIGVVGNSGRVSGADQFPGAGAHLHWEVWVSGIQVNPILWLRKPFP